MRAQLVARLMFLALAVVSAILVVHVLQAALQGVQLP